MWLEVKFIKEGAEEITDRQAETTLEVGDENHPFSIPRLRRYLGARSPTHHPGGDSPGLDQPIYLILCDSGALPGSAA